ncbi:hypothetical protein ACFY6U_50285 [Streptomyces sp. NPDC013157]|uniref:hypothetical protein n=1 Tax=Streptomyces sp. NPDC013157 TaxID=3364861 RepID=UPI0036C4B0C8
MSRVRSWQGCAARREGIHSITIDGDDNETGGRRLDHMYTLNRILDGDAFYMKITN